MLFWLIGVLALWVTATLVATRTARRPSDLVIAGGIVGLATMLIFAAASIARVNLFLDVIQYRDDWQNLVARYHDSGFKNLRVYANYEYFKVTPLLASIGAVAGLVSGAVGAGVNGAIRTTKAWLGQPS